MSKSFQLSPPKADPPIFVAEAFSYQLLLIALSSLFLILSFPNFNLEFLAWFGLVPLLLAVERERPLKSFFIAYITGVLFFAGTIYWLIHVTLPGMIVVVLYLALYFGLFGLCASYFLRAKSGDSPFFTIVTLFTIPALWVTMELARARVFGGFGWALLAHSQSYNLPFIQIADIFGAYGVSFLVAMVNTAFFLTVKSFRKKMYSTAYILVTLILVFAAAAYGTIRLRNVFTGEMLKVAVVQGNIPQIQKWDSDFRESILIKYETLTRKAAELHPDLIIWPETSVPGYIETEKDIYLRVSALVKSIKTPVLVGAPTEDTKGAYYNSAVFFSETGQAVERYDKIHLVPFGEYIPAKNLFSFVENFASSPIGDFTGGKIYTVFKFFVKKRWKVGASNWNALKKVKFSVLICFEDIFPDLTRQFVKNGANCIINITNDAWFGDSSAPFQHAQSSVFRAVENRVNVIRAANTGLSCFINQKGRITGAVEKGGKNISIDGIRVEEIILAPTRTFYTTHGDVFAYICTILTLALLIKRSKRFLA